VELLLKCFDCRKRIWKQWQPWCSAELENDEQLYDYHKKCFKRNHYKEWKFFHPNEVIQILSGEKAPKTGWYAIADHNRWCDKTLQAENPMFMVKKDTAPKLMVCQHDVMWELMREYYG